MALGFLPLHLTAKNHADARRGTRVFTQPVTATYGRSASRAIGDVEAVLLEIRPGDLMNCTTRILGMPWTHHAWRRRVTSTDTIPTSVTDMWGRPVTIEHVRCHTEEVCDACGAVRDTGYCLCDAARGDACRVRLEHLNPARALDPAELARARNLDRPHAVPAIHGYVTPGFEAVREAFADNFSERHELGGACCVYLHGEKVVDLWAGIRDKHTGAPWDAETMVIVHSATKGLSAMTLALAHSRGWLNYDERVSAYWPEFAQAGKQDITVRQLLAHQAGLFALDEEVDRAVVADLDRLAVILARQKPAWEPGTRQAYHAITLGYYENELLRRIDPKHRSLGQFFEDEIATPLELDFYIRLPESIPNSRFATLAPPSRASMLLGFPVRLTIEGMNRHSNIVRALRGSEFPLDPEHVYSRNLEVPSGGGIGTARAIARAYSEFVTGGGTLHLRRATLDALSAPATSPTHGFFDECMKGEVRFSLGFMKPSVTWPFGSDRAFGSPGAGGAFGYADPETGIGYGYVTSQMGTTVTGDPRDVALRQALDACVAGPLPVT